LQDARAIELLIRAAADQTLAIVPELHPAYAHLYNRGNARRLVYETAKAGWDEEIARNLLAQPILNSGVFALRRDAPHWLAWQEQLRDGLSQSAGKLLEQTALNLAVYGNDLPFHALPAWCNWVCVHASPVIDLARRCLTEPTLPHEKLSIIHVTTLRDQRAAINTTDGKQVEADLSYRGIASLLQGASSRE
jgi:hypothetical protein